MASRLKVLGKLQAGYEEILSPDALAFVEKLVEALAPRIDEALTKRAERQKLFDAGEKPDFLPETKSIRDSDWTVGPLPKDLLDRRVEITGPVDRKMVINALNSGARCFMADLEDSTAPTWDNVVQGQINLRDAVDGSIEFHDPNRNKDYKLNDERAVLLVRPRGFHLYEKHVEFDGKPIPAGLFDFGLYFFHNAKNLLKNGTGPYFYLPKLEAHPEARIWNDAFVMAQSELGVANGTIKATVLIETLPAAFEMDEILWELKDHSAGLNCGRWDYIFSAIKRFHEDPALVMPDRSQVGMTQPFMRAYTQLVIKTCHKRRVHAIGGMAAQIPLRDPVANEVALEKVRADKLREVTDGHDGTWVAHPGLVPLALEIFDAHMKGPNQLFRLREDVEVTAADLLRPATGTRTEDGLRQNIDVGIHYLEAWLRGSGCVPLNNLMEDAATAEISRAQVWQWIRHSATLEDGRTVTKDLVHQIKDEVLAGVRERLGDENWNASKFEEAGELFEQVATGDTFEEFLTLPAYDRIISPNA